MICWVELRKVFISALSYWNLPIALHSVNLLQVVGEPLDHGFVVERFKAEEGLDTESKLETFLSQVELLSVECVSLCVFIDGWVVLLYQVTEALGSEEKSYQIKYKRQQASKLRAQLSISLQVD